MKLFSRKVSLLITALVLVVFIFYFILNIDKFRPLLHINIGLLLLIALANMAVIGVNGLFTKVVLVQFGKFIGLVESYYVSLISSIGNFFAPAGAGFIFRAVYLKKKHSLPYSEYLSILSGNYVFVFMVSSLLGLLALFLLNGHNSPEYYALLIAFTVMLAGSLILSFVRVSPEKLDEKKNPNRGRAMTILVRVINGWNAITAHKRLMVRLFGLTLVNAALSFIIIWLIITSLHFHASFPALLLFSVLGALSLFINITPANLGIKEAIYIFSSSVLGFSISQIVLIALVDRGVLFLVLLIMWALSSKVRGRNVLKEANELS